MQRLSVYLTALNLKTYEKAFGVLINWSHFFARGLVNTTCRLQVQNRFVIISSSSQGICSVCFLLKNVFHSSLSPNSICSVKVNAFL